MITSQFFSKAFLIVLIMGATIGSTSIGSGIFAPLPLPPPSYYLVTLENQNENKEQKALWKLNSEDSNDESALTKKEEISKLTYKNYTCEFLKRRKDSSCELFSIKKTENNKAIGLKTLKNFIAREGKETDEITKTINTSDFLEPKFFILKISSAKKDLIKTDGSSSFDLLLLEKTEGNKKTSYANFTVNAEITKQKVEGTSSTLIAKVVSGADTHQLMDDENESVKQHCYFKSAPDKKISCNLAALAMPEGATKAEDIEFKNVNLEFDQKPITLVPDKFFLIAFTNSSDYQLSDLEDKSIIAVVTNKNSVTGDKNAEIKTTELKIESPIFVALNGLILISQVVMLK